MGLQHQYLSMARSIDNLSLAVSIMKDSNQNCVTLFCLMIGEIRGVDIIVSEKLKSHV